MCQGELKSITTDRLPDDGRKKGQAVKRDIIISLIAGSLLSFLSIWEVDTAEQIVTALGLAVLIYIAILHFRREEFMFKEMTEELLGLAREAMETKAYVSINLSNDYMNIGILDTGWDKTRDYDGFYALHDHKELSLDNNRSFRAAKAHLGRLIRENRNETERPEGR